MCRLGLGSLLQEMIGEEKVQEDSNSDEESNKKEGEAGKNKNKFQINVL